MADLTPHSASRAASRFAHLAASPLFILPTAAAAFVQGPARADWAQGVTPGAIAGRETNEGIVTIPVRGALENRKDDAWYGVTSYEGLRESVSACLDDAECRAIVLDIDSPGGVASGAMETAAFLREVNARKPVVAFVDGMACSAAYALATGAGSILVTPSAILGSIGCVLTHWDMSGLLESWGLKATSIYAGAFKTDGSPYKPLDAGEKARLQAFVGRFYDHFTATVGLHRPEIGDAGARATEAAVYDGGQAIDIGLADGLATHAQALRFAAGLAPSSKTMFAAAARRQQAAMAAGFAIRADAADVKLHRAGERHAQSLIEEGKVDLDGAWSFSAADGDKLLGDGGDDWDNYGAYHLGEDAGYERQSKAHWKYPFGKEGQVFRRGVVAAKERAAQAGASAIEEAADRLLKTIDGKQEKANQMADQEALAAARAEGVREARARIGSILKLPQAEGRAGLAQHLAFESEMTPDAAAKLLEASPKEAAASVAEPARAASRLDRVMQETGLREDGQQAAAANEFERGQSAFAALFPGREPRA